MMSNVVVFHTNGKYTFFYLQKLAYCLTVAVFIIQFLILWVFLFFDSSSFIWNGV